MGFEPQAPEGSTGLDVLAVLEAMLFASPEPLSLEELQAGLAPLSGVEIEAGLDALARALGAPGRGLRLERIAGGYRLVTRPDLAEPLRALFRFRNQKRLTPATLDVLAIIAYAQPITAPEIQEIRGTDPAHGLRVLQDRKLVRMVGRKRVVGRPILYGTTREFLIHFGLDSLEELPSVEAYGTRVVPAQGRLFPVTQYPGTDTGEGDPEIEPLEEELESGEGRRLEAMIDETDQGVSGAGLAAAGGEPSGEEDR